MPRAPLVRFAAIAAAAPALALAVACGSDLTEPQQQDLETLIQATDGFHALAAGQAAGHTLLFNDMCMENQPTGGMGYHYVNTDLLDGSVSVAAPEALMYADNGDGELRLVGVEYVVPFAAVPQEGPAPVLFEQAFKPNTTFGLWTLHVWHEKDNPSGLFADWNPDVSCP